MKTYFSEGKLMKQLETPLSKRTPLQFSTNPLFLSIFHDPLFVQILKQEPHPPNFRERNLTFYLEYAFKSVRTCSFLLHTINFIFNY